MKFAKRIKNMLLTILGDLKFFPIPPVIVHAPNTFSVKGKHTRRAMGLIKPGDLILRKYHGYLDGIFIPGKYSHTGIYVGNGYVIHAVAEGVCREDIIDFLRCDKFTILRPRCGQSMAITRCTGMLGSPYDFDFKSGNRAMYCHELAADAYHELGVVKKIPTLMKGLIRGKSVFLADSFLSNDNFSTVYEFEE
jgi:hypothetical protein